LCVSFLAADHFHTAGGAAGQQQNQLLLSPLPRTERWFWARSELGETSLVWEVKRIGTVPYGVRLPTVYLSTVSQRFGFLEQVDLCQARTLVLPQPASACVTGWLWQSRNTGLGINIS